jgi:DNA-binding response OmpR family regulator
MGVQIDGLGTARISTRHRLLIGERDEVLRGIVVDALLTEGYEVSAATTGSELVDKLAVSLHPEYGSVSVDLVVADARLLGPQEFRRLGHLADWARIPPFVLLVDAATELPGWTADLGIAVAIDKPVDLDHLRRIARSLAASELADWASLPANTVM